MWIAAVALGWAAATEAAADAEAKPPNIVFLLTDDQRNDTLGCAGHPIVKTPNIDRLAREGVRFQNMFVTTSICAASRATIFTGLHERTHGYTFGKPPVSAAHVAQSYPVLLRKAGYRTGFVGKFGVAVAGGKAAKEEMFDAFREIGRNPYLKKMPDGSLRHETELDGDFAVAFIRDNPAGKPFCISVSFNASHAEDGDKRPGIGHYPWPKAVDGMYEDVPIPAPRLSDPKYFETLPEFLRTSMNRNRYFWRWDTPEKYATNMRAYFRMLTGIDGVVGRIRKALEEKGVAENTVIIYTADNGYYMGDRGFAGKWSHFEQSLRVPLVVYDPRLPEDRRGRVATAMALNIDLPSTMVDLAGAPVPAGYAGRSLVPLLRGEAPADWRRDFFCEHLMEEKTIPKWEGVRGQRYVYARYFDQSPPFEFLHDLKTDPDEFANLATDPGSRATLEAMRKRCDELRDRYGGPYVSPTRETGAKP
ncbi:MAG: sulfatase [Planctomycetes bacterium]|nr:sulfatase [Planctomycetota bacterium]